MRLYVGILVVALSGCAMQPREPQALSAVKSKVIVKTVVRVVYLPAPCPAERSPPNCSGLRAELEEIRAKLQEGKKENDRLRAEMGELRTLTTEAEYRHCQALIKLFNYGIAW